MKTRRNELRLGSDNSIGQYRCGLKDGALLRLLKPIRLRENGRLTGQILEPGGVWTVVRGSKISPGIIWLKQPDGKLHTWDDNDSLFEVFEVKRAGPTNNRQGD